MSCNSVTIQSLFEENIVEKEKRKIYNILKTLFKLINNLLREFVRMYEKFVRTPCKDVQNARNVNGDLYFTSISIIVFIKMYILHETFPHSNNLLLTKLTSLRIYKLHETR